jgi:hypothetical protein
VCLERSLDPGRSRYEIVKRDRRAVFQTTTEQNIIQSIRHAIARLARHLCNQALHRSDPLGVLILGARALELAVCAEASRRCRLGRDVENKGADRACPCESLSVHGKGMDVFRDGVFQQDRGVELECFDGAEVHTLCACGDRLETQHQHRGHLVEIDKDSFESLV